MYTPSDVSRLQGKPLTLTIGPRGEIEASSDQLSLGEIEAVLKRVSEPGVQIFASGLITLHAAGAASNQPNSQAREDINRRIRDYIVEQEHHYVIRDAMVDILGTTLPASINGKRNSEYSSFVNRCKNIEKELAANIPGMKFASIAGKPSGTRGLVPE